MRPRPSTLFLAAMLATAVASGIASYVASWTASVAGCHHAPIKGAFLAYCTNDQYGDYEHGAFYFDLQPRAVRAAQRADVMFLGPSTTQFAFSTTATRSFFAGNGVAYYLMGLGYGESARFFDILQTKYRLRPKLTIINVDSFFDTEWSEPATVIADHPWRARITSLMQNAYSRTAGPVCALLNTCGDGTPEIYRDEATGAWIWSGILAPPTLAVWQPDPKDAILDESQKRDMAPRIRAVIDRIPTSRDCIVVTGVPNPMMNNEALAQFASDLLHLQLIQPQVGQLYTIDGEHLNLESAERWSEAFLRLLAPAVEKCVGPRQ